MNSRELEVATLGGGCFWCLEAIYQELKGVDRVVSGYSGGDLPDPSYEEISTGLTGHAEVVQVVFDPGAVTYRDLLQIFFTLHDPTTPNRQGPDVGTQYRSVVFYHTEEQKTTVQSVIVEFGDEGIWPEPIVTQVEPCEAFYPAEDYHRDYYRLNPEQFYCQVIITPKLAKLRQKFVDKLVLPSERRG